MRILASDPVKLSGLNEGLINGYRMREEDQVKVQSQSVVRDGKKYQEFSFLMPRFVSGYAAPQGFGGFWVSNVPAKGGKVIMEIVDGEDMLASEIVNLVPVDPPKVSRTPKKYLHLRVLRPKLDAELRTAKTGNAGAVQDDGIQCLE